MNIDERFGKLQVAYGDVSLTEDLVGSYLFGFDDHTLFKVLLLDDAGHYGEFDSVSEASGALIFEFLSDMEWDTWMNDSLSEKDFMDMDFYSRMDHLLSEFSEYEFDSYPRMMTLDELEDFLKTMEFNARVDQVLPR